MQYDLFSQPQYKFFCLSSGSSGNCYYIGNQKHGILIDAGIGIRTIHKYLREYGVSFDKIIGILVTHDHADHIKTVGCLSNKYHIPIYATQAVHQGIERSRYTNGEIISTKRIIQKETPFSIKDLKITAFEVPHDSIENVGYHIVIGNNTFVLITDMGRVTDTITQFASKATHLVIETNYDEAMLQHGSYPYILKQRIASGTGHISNRLSAEFIASIYTPKLKNIWLCHLSQDNNRPELAHATVTEKLRLKGIIVGTDIQIEVLSRHKASGLKDF